MKGRIGDDAASFAIEDNTLTALRKDPLNSLLIIPDYSKEAPLQAS